ncbi:hypothetical protein BYT27DRAFT_7018481, partial [Phlegmacium glaucopus]
IPEGYVVIIGPDEERYVVPQFMVPALHQMFDGYRKKADLEGSSDWERLSAHAEVLALQERLGISYKNASHRLYMAELERLKSDEKMHTAFVNLQV